MVQKRTFSVLTVLFWIDNIFPVGHDVIDNNDTNRQRRQVEGNLGEQVYTNQVTTAAITASAGDNCDYFSPPIQQCHASGTLQQSHNEHNINNSTSIGRGRTAAADVLHSSAPSGRSSAGSKNRREKRKLETTTGDSNDGRCGKQHCCSSSPPSPISFTESNNRNITATNHSDHNNKALSEIEHSIKLLKSAQKRLMSESYMNPSMDELDGIIDKLEWFLEKTAPRQCQVSTGQQKNDEECELSNGKKVHIMTLLFIHSSINSYNYYV